RSPTSTSPRSTGCSSTKSRSSSKSEGEGTVEDRPNDEASAGEGERRRPGAPRPSNEGVRIIGAEEAAAALEAGQVSGRRPEDEPRFGDVPEQPRGPRPSLSFPRQGDDDAPRTEARRLFQPPPARDRAVYTPPPPAAAAEPPAREPPT